LRGCFAAKKNRERKEGRAKERKERKEWMEKVILE